MRLILDTNVVMSALLWRGKPYQLLEAIRQRSNLQLYSSGALLEELADVLTRPSATKRLALIDKHAREVLLDYIAAVQVIDVAPLPQPVCRDPDDDVVLALALAASADLIARIAHGMANDLVTTAILACPKQRARLLAPAMNPGMLAQPAVQRNLEQLRRDGWTVVEPETGHMACGDDGAGRLPETAILLARVAERLKA